MGIGLRAVSVCLIGEMSGLTKNEVRGAAEGSGVEGWADLESLIIKAVDELKENT